MTPLEMFSQPGHFLMRISFLVEDFSNGVYPAIF